MIGMPNAKVPTLPAQRPSTSSAASKSVSVSKPRGISIPSSSRRPVVTPKSKGRPSPLRTASLTKPQSSLISRGLPKSAPRTSTTPVAAQSGPRVSTGMSWIARAAGASASQSPAARITATAGAARAATTQQSSTSSQTEDCSQYDLAIQQLEQALLESHAQIEDLIGQLEMLSSGQGDAASLIADLQSKLQTAQLENTELRVQSSTNAAENASSTAASGSSNLPWIVAGSAAVIALGLGVKVFMAK